MPAVHPDIHDAALAAIRDAADRVVLVTGTPADYLAIAGTEVAAAPVTPADFSIAAGAVSGRTLTIAQVSSTATATGDVTHLCVVDDTTQRLLLRVVEAKAEIIYTDNPVLIGPITYELRDPA